MRKEYLYDKVNKRNARYYFIDSEGNFFIPCDKFGIQMDGKISIIPIGINHHQYEIRQFNTLYPTDK